MSENVPALDGDFLRKRLPIPAREVKDLSQQKLEISRKTWRRASLAGYAVLLGFVVIFGGWATVVPLASAVRAPGQLRVASEQQQVQHLEGGIVKELLVHEGQFVKKGETLLRLDPLQSNSQYAKVRTQIFALLAEQARLLAQRDFAKTVTFPERLMREKDDPDVAQAIRQELSVFRTEQQAYEDQRKLSRERIAQYRTQIGGAETRLKATVTELEIIAEELTGVRALFERGLERKPRVLNLERQQAQLSGIKGQLEASIAQLRQAIGEQETRFAAFQNEYDNRIASALKANTLKLQDLGESETLWKDRIERIEIKAPRDGQVVNMSVHTETGVVKPGEVLMNIVPTDDDLIVAVKVQPKDIDALMVGAPVELQLSAFNPRTTPPIQGILTSVSLDIIKDERGREFFEGRIVIDEESVKRNIPDVRLTAGMQVSSLISVGERTLLEYLATPLIDSFKQAMREP